MRVGGLGIACFFYCSMLILQRPLCVKTQNDAILLDASTFLFFVANNRIIESKHSYSCSRIWQESYSEPPYIRFDCSRITK